MSSLHLRARRAEPASARQKPSGMPEPFAATFLHRPVLAIVLSVVLVLLGVLAARSRPVSQFPEISPPRVMISLAFPGASADVLVQSSLITLERAINGVPGMIYMTSDATSAGEAVIQVVFDLDADPEELNDLSADASMSGVLEQCRGKLLAMLDPVEVDQRAKARQAELLAGHGGREAVIARGDLGFTPAPGVVADFQ